MNDLASIADFSNALAQRQLTAVQLTEACIENIHLVNDDWNVFAYLLNERALQAAAASDERRNKNALQGQLDGVPIAIKDNLHLSGYSTSAGTRHDFSPDFTATASVVTQLELAGAIVIGKCAMDEGALGASTNNPFTGQCHNPAHPGRTPGGSSGGSAAAVAANFVAASLGTDTMGSVRIPAAYCDLWALKPTNGWINSDGLVPLSPTLDSIGPIAHSAADLILMLAAMTNVQADQQQSSNGLSGLRIGVISADLLSEVDADVLPAFEHLVNKLADAGCIIETVNLDQWNPGQLRRDGLLLSEVQAGKALAGILKDKPDFFSDSFHKMMAYGQSVDTERLEKSLVRMNDIKVTTLSSLQTHSALLMPTAPQLAFAVDAKVPANQADFTALANVAGCPAAAFPIPVPGTSSCASAQIMGQPGSDF